MLLANSWWHAVGKQTKLKSRNKIVFEKWFFPTKKCNLISTKRNIGADSQLVRERERNSERERWQLEEDVTAIAAPTAGHILTVSSPGKQMKLIMDRSTAYCL